MGSLGIVLEQNVCFEIGFIHFSAYESLH